MSETKLGSTVPLWTGAGGGGGGGPPTGPAGGVLGGTYPNPDALITPVGTTAARPVGALDGTQYLDTDLGFPIWKLGANWIDAAGTVV